jgi:hypothetical protein
VHKEAKSTSKKSLIFLLLTRLKKDLYIAQKDEWVYGKINNSDSEIMLKTIRGDLLIRIIN